MEYPEHVTGETARFERWDAGRHTAAFAALSADPEVMQYLGGPWPRAVAAEVSARIADHWETFGFGLWAVVLPAPAGGADAVVGFAGACRAAWLPGYEHEVEVGWRLTRRAWGRGLTSEGGRLALAASRAHIRPARVIAVVDPRNARSLRVADRLGLRPTDERGWDPRLRKRVLILA